MTLQTPPEAASQLPTYEDVAAAAERIDGIAHRTPVLTSRTADERTGGTLFFKAENLQRGGAFKFRGAYNAIARLSPEAKRRGVVAFSSGNHAQAIAYAGQLQQVPDRHHHAAGRAGDEGRGDQGLWRRGRSLRPLQGGPRGHRAQAVRRSAGSR